MLLSQWMEPVPAGHQQMLSFPPFFQMLPVKRDSSCGGQTGFKFGDVITKGLNRPPGTQWAVVDHHDGHLKGGQTQALCKDNTHFCKPLFQHPTPPPELWRLRSACLPSAWLMCEWRIPRSCMYRSDRAKPRPKVLCNYGDPPLRKGNALKTHHAGLVICLIIFRLKTHGETGKERNATKWWQWYIFNADKSSYTCHNINSVITLITKCISA